MLVRGTFLIWLLTAVAYPASAEPASAEPVTIVLDSGQRLTGLVDAQTDDQRLWLRFQRGAAFLRRPFAWPEVHQAFIGDAPVSPAVLRQRSGDLASVIPPRAKPTRPRSAQPAADAQAEGPTRPPGRPATLRIEAAAGNWDTDVEPDGLLLTVIVEDADGERVPTAGTLTVELIGQPVSPGDVMGRGGVTRLQNYPTLANWVRQVVPEQAGADGYTFRLGFQALDPDFNLRVGIAGLVHARLFVPGVGALDASTSTIALRQFNPLRDQWQMQQQGRFFPQEQTGRSKQLQ
jgi:hypothetical protein